MLVAILTLAFIPFLLLIKSNAENVAVYVYYLLVVGVLLQLIQKDVHLSLTDILDKTLLDILHLIIRVCLLVMGIAYFWNYRFWSGFILSLGVYGLILLLYGVRYLLNEDKS